MDNDSKNYSKITFQLPADQREKFVEITKRNDVFMGEVLRQYVQNYIKANLKDDQV